MKIEPIIKQTISDQVFAQMKEMVLHGTWQPGQKLPSENDLAASFHVSRITVRQALQKMSMIGLVETRSGEGSFITSMSLKPLMNSMIPIAYFSENDMQKVLEFRQVVEVETAGIAAEKATPEKIEELRALYREMNSLAENQRWREFAENDLAFHFKIAEMTDNELIIETNTILRDVLRTAMDQIVDTLGSKIGIYYHGRLLDAIENHDSKRTKSIMREHLRVTLNKMYPKKSSVKARAAEADPADKEVT